MIPAELWKPRSSVLSITQPAEWCWDVDDNYEEEATITNKGMN